MEVKVRTGARVYEGVWGEALTITTPTDRIEAVSDHFRQSGSASTAKRSSKNEHNSFIAVERKDSSL
jgi:hypothetical protein